MNNKTNKNDANFKTVLIISCLSCGLEYIASANTRMNNGIISLQQTGRNINHLYLEIFFNIIQSTGNRK